MWSTEIELVNDRWEVHLQRNGETLVVMSLDEWASLSATRQCARSEEPQAPYRHE
jgi:hypothetical protein